MLTLRTLSVPKPFASPCFHLSRKALSRRSSVRRWVSTSEVRIGALEQSATDIKKDIQNLQNTDRTLLQVVDGKAVRYESQFDVKLEKFSQALRPLKDDLTSLKTDFTSMKTDLTLIKYGGSFVAAVLAAVIGVFGDIKSHLPQLQPAMLLGIFVFAAILCAIRLVELFSDRSKRPAAPDRQLEMFLRLEQSINNLSEQKKPSPPLRLSLSLDLIHS